MAGRKVPWDVCNVSQPLLPVSASCHGTEPVQAGTGVSTPGPYAWIYVQSSWLLPRDVCNVMRDEVESKACISTIPYGTIPMLQCATVLAGGDACGGLRTVLFFHWWRRFVCNTQPAESAPERARTTVRDHRSFAWCAGLRSALHSRTGILSHAVRQHLHVHARYRACQTQPLRSGSTLRLL